ncbi:MAG: type IX secretion system membrane protein PorP/SprF [Bacteroidota bacterium]
MHCPNRWILLWLSVSLTTFSLHAQQDPSITTYLFNTLAINPAYAGSQDYLSINFLNRNQWLGWTDGNGRAPSTQIVSAHSPFNNRVGLGLHLSHDVIGATRMTNLNAAYAYRIAFPFGTISAGVQLGLVNWAADWSRLNLRDNISLDPAFSQVRESRFTPNVGAGVYFQHDYFYAGFSVPRILTTELTKDNTNTLATATLYRHFYFTAGGIIPILSDDIVFKPAMLIRRVTGVSTATDRVGAPTSVDLDASIFLLQTLWLGTSYRWSPQGLFGNTSSHDSIDFWGAFYLSNGFRVGLAYDIGLTPIRRYSNGSLEIMIGYDFNVRMGNVRSPRYY